MGDPRALYRTRLDDRRGRAARYDRADARLALCRLAIAVCAIVLAVFAFRRDEVSWAWLGLPAVAFLACVVAHARVIRSRRRAERAVAFYEDGLARLDDRPAASGDGGARFLDDDHLYAADLDLFGPRSLFARLDTTRTRPGAETLASWLRAPAGPDAVRARQRAVDELRGAVDLREDLAVLGDEMRAEADTERLDRWAGETDAPGPSWLGRLAPALALVTTAAAVGWAAGAWGGWPLVVALAVQSSVVAPYRRRIARILARASGPEHDLELLAAVLDRFERERFDAPLLVDLRRRLESGGRSPSGHVRALARRLDLADARRNQLFAPVALALLWGTQCAFALAAWRARHGTAVREWLRAVGELEALSALAGWAFEHPEDPFPDLVDDRDGPWLDARALGHPLIPASRRVCNDVRLGGDVRLLVVSGSNMSGKSTLLRTVGVNVVLALAGAPVCARSFRLTAVAAGATLRIQDSLAEGESRFYAEVSRLRAIVDRAEASGDGGPPVLFLLDEILAGTNSRDRAVGAEAVLRRLIDRGAIGLVTTHDLALTELAERLAPAAENVHFEDDLVDGRLSFDYRMKPGAVRHGNALAVMRSVGLDV